VPPAYAGGSASLQPSELRFRRRFCGIRGRDTTIRECVLFYPRK
jgi:hypothetical protein